MRTDEALGRLAYDAWRTWVQTNVDREGGSNPGWDGCWAGVAAAVRLAVVNDLTADLGAALNPGRALAAGAADGEG